jgi:chemotaxis protein CheX
MLQSTISPTDAPASSPLFAASNNTSLLDQSVEEVFALMLGTPVTVSEIGITPTNIPITLTAVIGLAGALSGAYSVVVNESAAKQIAASMLGIEVDSLDDTVYDALGEITNILAGAWKSKIESLHAACLLSVPTVVTGTHYDIHKKSSSFRLSRSYRFNDSSFTISIYGEQP